MYNRLFDNRTFSAPSFTLAELLIVVAIIGVLVAISIPIFTSQLEKARDGVSIANIRAAYAQAQSAYLTADGKTANADTDVTVAYDTNGKVSKITVANVVIKSEKANNWSGVGAQLP
jgi:prepilin-type N-terminal cleavage/methylation domain-containing protein